MALTKQHWQNEEDALVHVVSDHTLREFYQDIKENAFAAGYKLVITALVREADAPTFFEDVTRYWGSLDDVTGQDILFVFAGPGAEKTLDPRTNLIAKRQPVAFTNSDLTMCGARRIHSPRPVNLRSWSPPAETGDDKSSRETLGQKHSQQMTALRRYLGLSEND